MSATVQYGNPPASAATRHIAASLPADMSALTSLRALLAWWVVAFHAAPLAPFHLDQAMPALGKGPVLVDCFFVLSGFVLFHVHPAILSGPHRRRAVAEFLVARLARLYPVHLAVLAGFVLMLGGLHIATGFRPADPAQFSAAALVEQILLLHGSVVPSFRAWNFPSWSISSEWAAYMLAPLMFRFIASASRPALLLGAAAVGVLVIDKTEIGWPASVAGLLLRVITEFCLGALLRALAGDAAATLRRFRRPALLAGWSAVASLAWSAHSGLFLAAMIWTMVFLSLEPGWGGRLGAVSRALGESSYAVYMCHALVLTVWAGLASRAHLGLLGTPLGAALLLCLSVQGLAFLLHHLVERPARTALRGWTGQWLRPDRARGAVRAGSQREFAPSSAPGSCASVSPSTSTT